MKEKEFQELHEKIKHGDAIFPIVKYYTQIPEQYQSFPVHWHEEMEVIIVREGRMQFTLDLKPYLVSAGDILILTPYTLHSFARLSYETCKMETLVFHLRLIDNSSVDICSLKYFAPVMNREIEFPFVIHSDEEGYQELKEQFEAMFLWYDSQEGAAELLLKASVFQFFSVLFRWFVRTGKRKEPRLEKIKPVLSYIEENYQKKLTLKELSEVSNMSEYHLSHCVKQCAGMTCIEYINHYRAAMASELLRETDWKVTAVALEVGFNNISYFNRIFRRYFGMTPLEYRENCGQGKGGS